MNASRFVPRSPLAITSSATPTALSNSMIAWSKLSSSWGFRRCASLITACPSRPPCAAVRITPFASRVWAPALTLRRKTAGSDIGLGDTPACTSLMLMSSLNSLCCTLPPPPVAGIGQAQARRFSVLPVRRRFAIFASPDTGVHRRQHGNGVVYSRASPRPSRKPSLRPVMGPAARRRATPLSSASADARSWTRSPRKAC